MIPLIYSIIFFGTFHFSSGAPVPISEIIFCTSVRLKSISTASPGKKKLLEEYSGICCSDSLNSYTKTRLENHGELFQIHEWLTHSTSVAMYSFALTVTCARICWSRVSSKYDRHSTCERLMVPVESRTTVRALIDELCTRCDASDAWTRAKLQNKELWLAR
jgi:hypothetical protein